MRPIALAVSLALFLVAGSVAAQPPAGPRPARPASLPAPLSGPAAVVDAFHAALARGDGPAAATTLDEAVVIYEEGWVDADKAAYVTGHLPDDLAFMKDMTETLISRTGGISGDLAWIATQGRMQGLHDGKSVDRDTTETIVLRRMGGGWRIVQMHWSSHPRKT